MRQCHSQRVLSRTITTLFCLLVGWECGVGRWGNCLICDTFEKVSHFPHGMNERWPDLSVEISTLNCRWTSTYQESAQNKFKAVIVISVDMLTVTSFTAVEWFISHLWKTWLSYGFHWLGLWMVSLSLMHAFISYSLTLEGIFDSFFLHFLI